jgi:sialidase-1
MIKRNFLFFVLVILFFVSKNSFAQKNEKVLVLYFSIADTTTLSTNTRVADVFLKIGEKTIFKETVFVGDKLTLSNDFHKDSLLSFQVKTYRGFVCEIRNGEEKYQTSLKKKVSEIKDTIFIDLKTDVSNTYQYLYYSLDERNNKPYRIPALAQCFNGTLLAFCDYRPCWADIGYGEVDIKLRTSQDYKTWSEESFVANGKGGENNVFECGFGDVAVVADRESDEVLVMCVAGRQVFQTATKDKHNFMARIRSNDGGKTWKTAEDVTSMFMDVEGEYNPILPKVYSMFFASGKIVQSKVFKAKGSKYYRLYASLLVNSAEGHDNYVVYSDDFGGNWKLLGGICIDGGDEAKVEELKDGSIVVSSRKQYGRYFNIFSFTNIAKAKGSWAKQVVSNEIKGGIFVGANACNGELLKVRCLNASSGKECDVLLQSLPTGDNRTNVTIFFKELQDAVKYTPISLAENWTKGLEVSDRLSAYSTMIMQADGNIGFLYEEGPNDYCIVYVPLSIEEITNGLYKTLSKD